MTIAFTIPGAPRTKNRSMPVRLGNGRLVLIAGASYRHWLSAALTYALPTLMGHRGFLPFRTPVEVTAVFYRDRASGDQDNFQKGLGDFLQRAGFVANDRQIHWTGATRLEKDAKNPRVEIKISDEKPSPKGAAHE